MERLLSVEMTFCYQHMQQPAAFMSKKKVDEYRKFRYNRKYTFIHSRIIKRRGIKDHAEYNQL